MTARSSGRFAIADELQGQYPDFKEYIENVARLRLEKMCGATKGKGKKQDHGNKAKQRLMQSAKVKETTAGCSDAAKGRWAHAALAWRQAGNDTISTTAV